jgi:hypothetical protein
MFSLEAFTCMSLNLCGTKKMVRTCVIDLNFFDLYVIPSSLHLFFTVKSLDMWTLPAKKSKMPPSPSSPLITCQPAATPHADFTDGVENDNEANIGEEILGANVGRELACVRYGAQLARVLAHGAGRRPRPR